EGAFAVSRGGGAADQLIRLVVEAERVAVGAERIEAELADVGLRGVQPLPDQYVGGVVHGHERLARMTAGRPRRQGGVRADVAALVARVGGAGVEVVANARRSLADTRGAGIEVGAEEAVVARSPVVGLDVAAGVVGLVTEVVGALVAVVAVA